MKMNFSISFYRVCRVCAMAVMVLLGSGFLSVQAGSVQRLILGFGESQTPPFKSMENKIYVGIDFDVIQEIRSRAGINIDLEPFPYLRLIYMLKHGLVDGAVGMFKTAEREQIAQFLDTPIAWTTMVIFVKKETKFSFGEINDLFGKKIGKVRGVSVSKEFDQAMQQKKFIVEETTTYEQSIDKLLTGRIEALVSPKLSTLSHLKKMGAAKKVMMLPCPVAPPKPLFILFSRAAITPEKKILIENIHRVVTDMKHEKRFEQIMQKYEIPETGD